MSSEIDWTTRGDARRLTQAIDDELDAVAALSSAHAPVSTLIVVGQDPIFAVGPDAFLAELLAVAGGTNALDAGDWVQLDAEALLATQAEVVIQSGDTNLQWWDQWTTLPAVANETGMRGRRVPPCTPRAPRRRSGSGDARLPASGGSMTDALTARRLLAAVLAGTALVAVSAVIGVAVGSSGIPVGDVLSALFGRGEPMTVEIVRAVRLPVVLMAIVVGANLGAGGAAMQGLLRNPLADPYILGISGGAALGASIGIVAGASQIAGVSIVPALAFGGAMAAVAVMYVVALRIPGGLTSRGASYSLLLSGVVLNALASAAILVLYALISPSEAQQILFWLMGTLIPQRPDVASTSWCSPRSPSSSTDRIVDVTLVDSTCSRSAIQMPCLSALTPTASVGACSSSHPSPSDSPSHTAASSDLWVSSFPTSSDL